MYLIVGLGNPAPEYEGTPHNVGFETIDLLSERNSIRLKKKRLRRAQIGMGTIAGERVVFLKPLTFMNLSGEAVGRYFRQNRIEPEKLLVVFDDIDLPLGTIRLRPKGGAGGHKGAKSIMKVLGFEDFPRLRIGIHPPGKGVADLVSYVLTPFKVSSRKTVKQSIEDAAEAVEFFIANGIDAGMNKFN